MPARDFTSQRLFVEAALAAGLEIACTPNQVNYLLNVLRLGADASVHVFNGRDGEWRARLAPQGKRHLNLVIEDMTRAQSGGPDIAFVFAPLKRARLDYVVQKATEMGVADLQPVMTQHTSAERVNVERMSANVIEAAEQCGILRVPRVHNPARLDDWLGSISLIRHIIFCDEAADPVNPIETLKGVPDGPLAVLVGPEGGFSDGERAKLLAHPAASSISLGPRILRADTAAVAALALVNAVLGDWRSVTQP
jgi:16S rRNA (uracil1498-N3)-methyltransferase